VAEGWNRERIRQKLKSGTLPELESGYIDPLLAELRSVASHFGLLGEAARQSDNPGVRGMAQALELAAGMVDDLLDEALETSLRRAIEENTWAAPQEMDG
jgi:hypothetical protein